jgi:hypothetical protein
LENAQKKGAFGIKRRQTPTIRRITPPSVFGLTARLPKPDSPPFAIVPDGFVLIVEFSGISTSTHRGKPETRFNKFCTQAAGLFSPGFRQPPPHLFKVFG